MIVKKLLLLSLMLGPAGAAAFPEIPFCPLGGPPGWYNRIFNDDHRYRPPPPYYRPAYPVVRPAHMYPT